MVEKPQDAVPAPAHWQRRLGIGLLVYSFIPVCTVELVALLPLTAGQIVMLGVIYIASGEIACLAAIAFLGKPFIEAFKQRIKGFLRRTPQPAPPKHIGKGRHYAGIALLFGSIVPYYIVLGFFLCSTPAPSQLRGLLYLLLTGEGLFFLSLIVLGGEFWARLKKLFEWPGRQLQESGMGGK